jgi:hypothetical protein
LPVYPQFGLMIWGELKHQLKHTTTGRLESLGEASTPGA